ncbi:MAG: twin-arginine translocase TatA/TatE family subunit [Coriobacteriia bacterium]|nr:twin-arginine translocase TatA/TatE family subunit [Coriobacteriia bacterium]
MAALPFGIGPMELGLVVLLALLFFGPKRLPQLGKSIGKTVKAIRDGVDGDAEEDAKKSEAKSEVKGKTDEEE